MKNSFVYILPLLESSGVGYYYVLVGLGRRALGLLNQLFSSIPTPYLDPAPSSPSEVHDLAVPVVYQRSMTNMKIQRMPSVAPR